MNDTEAVVLSLFQPLSDPPTRPPVDSPRAAGHDPRIDAPGRVRLRSVADPTRCSRVLGGAVLFALVLSVTAAVNLTGRSEGVAGRTASVTTAPVSDPAPAPPPEPPPAPVIPDPPAAVTPAPPRPPAAPSPRPARPEHASDRAEQPELSPEMRDMVELAKRWQHAKQGNR